MEIKRRADPDQQPGVECLPVFRHEALLLRCAQSDPDDVGAGAGHVGAEGGGLVGVERAVGRRVGADDFESGKARAEFFAQQFRHARCATVEIMLQPGGAAGVAYGEHEVGTIHAPDTARGEPNQRHAVGRGEKRLVENLPKRRVGARLADGVDRRDAHVAETEGAAGAQHEVAGLRKGEGGHADAEDVVAPVRRAQGLRRGPLRQAQGYPRGRNWVVRG